MSKIQFWLSFNNGAERIQLPVNPSAIEISSPFEFNDYKVSEIGEYTVIGERQQKEFAFSSFLPRDYNEGFCEYTNIPDPWEVIKKIESWRDSRQPMRLTVTGSPINYAVTLRDFTYQPDKAGNPGDIYYSVRFKQFTFINPKARS